MNVENEEILELVNKKTRIRLKGAMGKDESIEIGRLEARAIRRQGLVPTRLAQEKFDELFSPYLHLNESQARRKAQAKVLRDVADYLLASAYPDVDLSELKL